MGDGLRGASTWGTNRETLPRVYKKALGFRPGPRTSVRRAVRGLVRPMLRRATDDEWRRGSAGLLAPDAAAGVGPGPRSHGDSTEGSKQHMKRLTDAVTTQRTTET